MPTHKKIFIGGLGALTPIIMNLLVVDFNILLVNLTTFALIGYLIRVVVLFYLGGLVSYLHKDEKSPLKVFEFGIIAPALLTALINANNVEVPRVSKTTKDTTVGSHFFISAAYAQTDTLAANHQVKLKEFSMPKESFLQQMGRGFFGIKPKNVLFVFAGTHRNLFDAQQQAKKINELKTDFKAEIYKPYGNDANFHVVIGENLLLKRAQFLQQTAIAEKISNEIILWTFPDE